MPALLCPPATAPWPRSPVAAATRRDVLRGAGLLTVAGLLAACGAGGDPGAADDGGPTRPWRGDESQTTIPAAPRRVVMLDTIGTDLVATLGLADLVVGYAQTNAGIDGYRIPDRWVVVGTEADPDFEVITGLEPDLIVAWDGDPTQFDRLGAIAPVASIPDRGPFGWRDYWGDLGDVLGRRDVVDGYVAGIDRRIAELAAQIPPGTSLSLVRVTREGLGIYPGFYPADLIRDLGFATPPAQAMDPDGDPCCLDISLELVSDHDADHVFVAIDDDDGARERLRELEASPLWAQLGATRSGRLHVVPAGHWIQWGPASVAGALDDVAALVVGG